MLDDDDAGVLALCLLHVHAVAVLDAELHRVTAGFRILAVGVGGGLG